MAPRKSPQSTVSTIEYHPTTTLHFDPHNPRFYNQSGSLTEDKVIEEMLEDEAAQDLMRSIGEKGYFPGEPLLVARNQHGDLIVVEGNRRLAAVKLLNGEISAPARRKASIAEIKSQSRTTPPTELPCLVYQNRNDILRYLGYRHITGIKQWDSLSKARYLAELRDNFYNGVEDTSEQMRALARDIGSRPDYVAQLLTSLHIFDKSVSNDFYGVPINRDDVEFSYITTALNYRNITDWLGLNGRSDFVAEGLRTENLKKLLAWMFSKDQLGETILGETRRLKTLAAVVASNDAIAELEKRRDLDEAFLFTNGPEKALEEALNNAESRLRVVWEMLGKSSAINNTHFSLADNIFSRAKDIRNHIRSTIEDN